MRVAVRVYGPEREETVAYIHLERGYVPCGFLIVRDGADPHDESNTILVQSDWDFPGVASSCGWTPCKACDSTDGTIDCAHHTASDMIADAYDFLRERDGEAFEALDEYFSG